MTAALYQARSFPYLGAIFPMAATIPAVFMAVAQLVLELRATRTAPGTETRPKTKLTLGYFLSLVLFFLWIVFSGSALQPLFRLLFSSTAGSERAGSLRLSTPVPSSASRCS